MSEVISYEPTEGNGTTGHNAQIISKIEGGILGDDVRSAERVGDTKLQEMVDKTPDVTYTDVAEQTDSRSKAMYEMVRGRGKEEKGGGATIGYIKDENGPQAGEVRPYFDVTQEQIDKAKKEMYKDERTKINEKIKQERAEKEAKENEEKGEKAKGGEVLSEEIRKVLTEIAPKGVKSLESKLEQISNDPDKFVEDMIAAKKMKKVLLAIQILVRSHVEDEGSSNEIRITLDWINETLATIDKILEEEGKKENKEDEDEEEKPSKTKKSDKDDDEEDSTSKKSKEKEDDSEDEADTPTKKEEDDESESEGKIDFALIDTMTRLYESGREGSASVDIALYRDRYTSKLLEKRKLISKITWTKGDNDELKTYKEDYEKNLLIYAKQQGFDATDRRYDGHRPERIETEEDYKKRVADWEEKKKDVNPYTYAKRNAEWKKKDEEFRKTSGYELTTEYSEHLRKKPLKPISIAEYDRGIKPKETNFEYNKRLEEWAKTYFDILNEETLKALTEQLEGRVDEEAKKERTEGLFSGAYRRVKNYIRKHPAITALVTGAVATSAITLTPLGGIPIAAGLISGVATGAAANMFTERHERSRDPLIREEREDLIKAMDEKSILARLSAQAARHIRVGEGVKSFENQFDQMNTRFQQLVKERMAEKLKKELEKKNGESLSSYEIEKIRKEILESVIKELNTSIDRRHDKENTIRDHILRNMGISGGIVGLGVGSLTWVSTLMG